MSKSSKSSPLKWIVILAVLGGGGYAGYRYWQRPSQAPVEFQTAKVSKGDIIQAVTANGSLTPVRMVEIGCQISGVITEVKVDYNSRVKEGDIVAQIDPATYERALGQAEAELANSDAALELAQLNFDRARELSEASLISKSEYDATRIGLNQAKASVKTRQANVDRAKVDLSRTTIYAPMDGVIITRKVEAGQTVAASMNAPTLFILANDLAKMQIEAAVSEADVGGVEDGQTVEFAVDAFVGRPFQGKIQQVRFAATTNQNVVTYTTVVAVDNKDLKLRPGMTANAKIITAARRGVSRIPSAAVRFRPPAGANVAADPAAPVAAAAAATPAPVKLIETGPFAGLPEMPWMSGGERRRPTDEERASYTASLTAEQKQKYERIMEEMRARFAQRGAGGGGGGGGGGGQGGGGGGRGFGGPGGAAEGGGPPRRTLEIEGPKTATVYLVEKETAPLGGERTVLKPVSVKLGIGDGVNVEVLDGLKEGDIVATGTVIASAAASSAPRNPLNPFGGPGRR